MLPKSERSSPDSVSSISQQPWLEALIARRVAGRCRITRVILPSAAREPYIPPLLATNFLVDMRKPVRDPIGQLCRAITTEAFDV